MRRSMLAAVAAITLAPMSGQAFEICTISLDDATLETPHTTDDLNDWDGLVFGNGAAPGVPAGDIYREATDLEAAWLSRADDGTLQTNIKVADLGPGVMVNSIFYSLWTSGSGAEASRWASAIFRGVDVVYAYGYMTTNPVTNNLQFFHVGETTGSVDVEGDTISINLPAGTPWGDPEAGSLINGITAESRILAGSPESLPPNPSGLRRGFVYVADKAEEFCQARA